MADTGLDTADGRSRATEPRELFGRSTSPIGLSSGTAGASLVRSLLRTGAASHSYVINEAKDAEAADTDDGGRGGDSASGDDELRELAEQAEREEAEAARLHEAAVAAERVAAAHDRDAERKELLRARIRAAVEARQHNEARLRSARGGGAASSSPLTAPTPQFGSHAPSTFDARLRTSELHGGRAAGGGSARQSLPDGWLATDSGARAAAAPRPFGASVTHHAASGTMASEADSRAAETRALLKAMNDYKLVKFEQDGATVTAPQLLDWVFKVVRWVDRYARQVDLATVERTAVRHVEEALSDDATFGVLFDSSSRALARDASLWTHVTRGQG